MKDRYTMPPERRDRLIQSYRRILQQDIFSDGTRVCRSRKEHARECLKVLEANDTEGMREIGLIGFLDSLPILENSNWPHAETLIEWLWPHVPDRKQALATLRTWAMLMTCGPAQTEALAGTAFARQIRALDRAGLIDDEFLPEAMIETTDGGRST